MGINRASHSSKLQSCTGVLAVGRTGFSIGCLAIVPEVRRPGSNASGLIPIKKRPCIDCSGHLPGGRQPEAIQNGDLGKWPIRRPTRPRRLAYLPRLLAAVKTSYKRERQEKYFPAGSVPTLFCLGIQPNPLNVHGRSTSDFFARGLRGPSSPLWFHSLVVTAPICFLKLTSITIAELPTMVLSETRGL
jgi:hypothetical protein